MGAKHDTDHEGLTVKRRTLFQMLLGIFIAPKLPAAAPRTLLDQWNAEDGFIRVVDPRMPRWHFVAGQWVKADSLLVGEPNPDYVPYICEDPPPVDGLKINS